MKKIGEIKGVPVVEGNVNEVTKNQIHYKEEEGGIQLSKRSNDNKLNSITSGLSEGGGVKEYYYKTLLPTEQSDGFATMLFNIGCHSCLVEVQDLLQDGWQTVGVANVLFSLEITKGFLGYMKLIDSYDNIVYAKNDNSYVSSILPYYIIGDIYTRLEKFYKFAMGDSYDDSMIEEFKQVFQEITKEEYESMITYKPE